MPGDVDPHTTAELDPRRGNNTMFCSPGCRLNAERDRNRRKSAKRRCAPPGIPYTFAMLVDRSTDCHLCGASIDLSLKWPDLLSPSVDHLVPLAKGGLDGLENVALAHLSCNWRRRDADLVPLGVSHGPG